MTTEYSENQRPSWDEYFLDIAEKVAQRSTCLRLKVGALLVIRNKIIFTGYNGAPSGYKHCIDVGCRIVKDHCSRSIHAETNALKLFNPYTLMWGNQATLYVTHEPCDSCVRRARGKRVTNIKWRHPYAPTDS